MEKTLDKKAIFSLVDHTLLSPTSTEKDIQQILDVASQYKCASACIPPHFLPFAKTHLTSINSSLKLCTVIGFPLGYMTTESKVFEAKDALQKGADEIDMVINLAAVKSGNWTLVEEELFALRKATAGAVLKVIIETCYLTEEEKIKLTHLVDASGADFIKTSTGFGTAGATLEDIDLFKRERNPSRSPLLKIKAAGGMKTKEDVLAFASAGVERLGTSKAIALLQDQDSQAVY